MKIYSTFIAIKEMQNNIEIPSHPCQKVVKETNSYNNW
jgi:hypothetical protein